MKAKISLLMCFILFGCGEKAPEIPPFVELTSEQVQALSAGNRACYKIAASINGAFPDSVTQCSLINGGQGGLFKENFSFYLMTSTKQASEWNKWACLSVGKVMADGADVGMEKVFLKSNPTDKRALQIDAYVCRDLQRKAYSREISEFEVLKQFNRRSVLVDM